jgi:general transcription factor 3C polypeptide 6
MVKKGHQQGEPRKRAVSRGDVEDVGVGVAGREDDDTGWQTDEEELVHVRLAGTFAADELTRQSNHEPLRLIGLDTDEPIAQVGGQVFVGRHGHAVGTAIFLRVRDNDALCSDPVFDQRPSKTVEFVHKTQRQLTLRRVFLKRKASATAADEGQRSPGEEEDGRAD